MPGGTASPVLAAEALVTKISEAPRSAWGFDAPFGGPLGARRTDLERGLENASAAAADWIREGILEPLQSNAQVCALPLQPAPLIIPGMPAEMIARAASTYLLEVSPVALIAELQVDDLGVKGAQAPERRQALRGLADASLVRPMARALREHAITDGGMAALLCTVATWRGYRSYDHGALHAQAEYAAQGFVYC